MDEEKEGKLSERKKRKEKGKQKCYVKKTFPFPFRSHLPVERERSDIQRGVDVRADLCIVCFLRF